jgi:hypothetical protein
MLEDMIRLVERTLDVAAAQAVVQRDVGVALALQVLEIGERSGRLEDIVHDRLRGHRLDLVVHRGQRLVLDIDQRSRFFRDVRIGRQHQRDRLAGVAHLAEREYGLIVERRPVVRVGNDGADVLARDDAVHALDGLCRRDVDALDAPVRDRAAEDLPVQHPRQLQVMHVLGPPGHLRLAFEAGNGTADGLG